MKDSEFIELLNLYLDHEISAADAARLEAEVQSNPARRRVYQQYCRMQKACKMVVAEFQAEAEKAPAGDRKVVPFDPAAIAAEAGQRKRAGGFYTVGTFAALAACVAIVFVGRNREAALGEPSIVATQGVTPAAIAAPAPAVVAPAVANSSATRGIVSVAPRTQQPRLVSAPLFLTGNAQANAVFTSAVQQGNPQLAWIEQIKLAPLQEQGVATNALRFDAQLRQDGRPLGTQMASPPKRDEGEEMVTFLITNK